MDVDPSKWVLLPMAKSASNTVSRSDLTSSSLGYKLEVTLERTRELIRIANLSNINNSNNEAVLFLGMDSPELPMEEIVYGLQTSSGNMRLLSNRPSNYFQDRCDTFIGKAHLCPANDGGYGLVSVPKHAPASKIFSGVRWSNPLTAVSQLKALTDANVDVSVGSLMYDVDEPADVEDLAMRLVRSRKDENKTKYSSKTGNESDDLLTNFSAGINRINTTGMPKSYPQHTWEALVKLNVIQQ